MTNRHSQRTTSKRPITAQVRIKHTAAAGISNRPPLEEERRQEELERQSDRAVQSMARKDAAVREVIAGRMTLTEAAEEFRQAAGETLPAA